MYEGNDFPLDVPPSRQLKVRLLKGFSQIGVIAKYVRD